LKKCAGSIGISSHRKLTRRWRTTSITPTRSTRNYRLLNTDTTAIKSDGDNKTQAATDQAKYNTDFAAFRAEMAPFEAQTHADIAKWNAILAADKKACDTGGDSSLTTQLATDNQQLSKDQAALKNLLSADQKKIDADAAQMKKDGGGDKGGDNGGDKGTTPTTHTTRK
jgi:hypothetical protein